MSPKVRQIYFERRDGARKGRKPMMFTGFQRLGFDFRRTTSGLP